VRRAVLAAIWIIVGAAIWNGFFDLYISRGEREYLQKRAEFDLGLAAEPSMTAVMGEARHLGVIAATTWAALVTGLGLVTIFARPAGRHARGTTSEGTPAP
jgi:hypothetical protein